jgi:hypothetical protein
MPKAILFNNRGEIVDIDAACKDVADLQANLAVTQTHALLLYPSANCNESVTYSIVGPSEDPLSLDNLGFVPNSAQVVGP